MFAKLHNRVSWLLWEYFLHNRVSWLLWKYFDIPRVTTKHGCEENIFETPLKKPSEFTRLFLTILGTLLINYVLTMFLTTFN